MSSSSVTTNHLNSFLLPELIIFDLDLCLWSPEMYTLDTVPTSADIVTGVLTSNSLSMLSSVGSHTDDIHHQNSSSQNKLEGVVAVKSGYEEIRLFPAALTILQQFYSGHYGSNMRIAAASSADTPLAVSIGRAAMNLLEVLPGVTVRQVFAKGWPTLEGEKNDVLFEGNLQIGRTAPLTANKATSHFPRLRELTGVEYNKMLFFDDCLWGDHCANVAKACPGVVTQRTPRGLQMKEWEEALQAYHRKYS